MTVRDASGWGPAWLWSTPEPPFLVEAPVPSIEPTRPPPVVEPEPGLTPGPEPVPDLPPDADPATLAAWWRSWLAELVRSGAVARHLAPRDATRAARLIAAESQDIDAVRALVSEANNRDLLARYRDAGIEPPPEMVRRYG